MNHKLIIGIVTIAAAGMILPALSFAQTNATVGGCMTTSPENQLSCVYNAVLSLTNRVAELETRVSALENQGRNVPTPTPVIPVPQPAPISVPGSTPACNATTGVCAGPVSATGTTQTGTISQGSAGAGVQAIQQVLKAEGSFNYPTATGYFGAVTQNAVKAFQAENGIQATGVIDATTLQKIASVAAQVAPALQAQIRSIGTSSAAVPAQ